MQYVEFGYFAERTRYQSNYKDIDTWMEFFEEEYDCAGVCEPALFAWKTSIEEGRPKNACISNMKDNLNFTYLSLATITLMAALFLCLI